MKKRLFLSVLALVMTFASPAYADITWLNYTSSIEDGDDQLNCAQVNAHAVTEQKWALKK